MPAFTGLEHLVFMVNDLDAAAAQWRRLGFTLSPKGFHSGESGTANYTMMFERDYLELLGNLRPTPNNAAGRAFLETVGEGLQRVALGTSDAQASAAFWSGQDLLTHGPKFIERPVTRPDGSTGMVSFNVVDWDNDSRPEGMRLFACQHLTPQMVWLPELLTHANGAEAIAALDIPSADPEGEARRLAALADAELGREAGDRWIVRPGGERADLVFIGMQSFAALYPDVTVRPGLEIHDCVVRLVTASLEQAQAAIGDLATRAEGRLLVAAAHANGVNLCFEARR
ncbi:VOC family protein [Devosia honganensis]|uniref:VOC family protein n=1 Tax=Devosia honganensis TaxID=1610527 RepID=A0ABV7X3S3_9HYPH